MHARNFNPAYVPQISRRSGAPRPLAVAALCTLLKLGVAAVPAVAEASHPSTPASVPANKIAHGGAGVADVPMSLSTGRPSLSARINGGHPVEITFDSGAQGAVITQSFAKDLGLEVIGETQVGSPLGGQPIPAKIVSLGRLSVGDYTATHLDAVVLDDARLPKGTRLIISAAQFPDAQIELDFAALRFRLSKSSGASGDDWTRLNERGMTVTTLTIGGETIALYIDSGNPGWIDLPRSIAARLPLTGPLVKASEMRAVDRVVPRYAAPLDTHAQIADKTVKLQGTFLFADIPFANMGSAALREYRVLIDVPNKRWKLSFSGSGQPVIAPPVAHALPG